MRVFYTLLIITVASSLVGAQDMRTYGVKINVTDMSKAKEFYCDQLGFEVERQISESYILLKTNDQNKLFLHKVPLLLPESEKETTAGLTLQVNDLDKSIASLKAKGVDFGDARKRKEGVGYAMDVKNPFSKKVSLMHQTVGEVKPFKEPLIYNYGYLIPDMEKAIEFYSGMLGFAERSKRYLPLDMPLGHSDGSFGFMLHYRVGVEPTQFNISDNEHLVILFQTENISEAIKKLSDKGVRFLETNPVESPIGKYISFYDPFGYLSELYEIK
ncbi:MAG: VOC family protein [Cyclobacteriaceae bacterium]